MAATPGVTRRWLLAATGAMAAGTGVRAGRAAGQTTAPPELVPADLTFLAGAEHAAASVLDRAARSGRVTGTLQRRVAAMAAHHREHATAVAELAGGDPGPNESIVELFASRLGATAEEPEAAAVLLDMVNALVATHMGAMTALTDEVAYSSLASIIPVGSRHAAVLAHAAGRSPTSQASLPVTEPAAAPFDPAAFPPGG